MTLLPDFWNAHIHRIINNVYVVIRNFYDYLLVIVCAVPITVLLMTAICISIVFSLDRMQDITVNLQLPLILFLGDFFLQMFRGTRPVIMEYFVPLHNTMELVAETFLSQNKTWHTIVIYLFNLLLALIVLKVTFRKEESK